MNIPYKQISLLPWLELADIQIGNAIFWKYDASVISDSDTKAYLDKYVKCYVDKHQQSVKTISIASYKDKNYFEPLTSEEYQELNFARNILCLLGFGRNQEVLLG